jgi:hypothetical protein
MKFLLVRENYPVAFAQNLVVHFYLCINIARCGGPFNLPPLRHFLQVSSEAFSCSHFGPVADQATAVGARGQLKSF